MGEARKGVRVWAVWKILGSMRVRFQLTGSTSALLQPGGSPDAARKPPIF